MSFKSWFVRIITFSIFFGSCLGSYSPPVNAQDIPTDQPTNTSEIQATETPTETPVPQQPSETPLPTDTPMPEPTGTNTPDLLPTETATVDLTATITPTETGTPTPTPTEIKTEENWRIEYDLFYSSVLMASMGGQEAAETELRGYLTVLDNEPGVSYNLALTTEGDGSLFSLVIDGLGGLEHFRHIYLDVLAPRFGTTSGITQLWIYSSGKMVPEWQLALDSNITTGYSWHLIESNGVTITSEGYQDGTSGDIGAMGRQYFSLRNDGSETYSLSLKYSSPWEAGVPPARRIILNIPLQADMSLASPEILAFMALSAPAPEELSLLQAAPEMDMLGVLPDRFDWRDSGMVPPVRNQGSCGSCYAFATVGVMESAMLINGISADLSEQFLVSCTNGAGYINNGCSGGRPDSHIYHVGTLAKEQSAAGAVFESAMPYTASESTCYVVSHPYRLMSWHTVNPTWNTIPDTETLKNIIYNNGPVAASICSLSAFNNYPGGIFTTNETCSGSPTNHAIILTGWITDPTHGTVWVLRNSWGTWWGDNGYMLIKAGTSSVGYNATYVVYEPLEDHTAPVVSKLDSVAHTPDNVIVINEDITVGVTQLLVSYNENMYYANGVNDVATLSNYSLINLGANNVVGGGDDISITINSAAYNVSTRIATLSINNNSILPNAAYQFIISGSGSVKDEAGSLLDGDSNGVTGGDYVMTFRISAKPPAPALAAPLTGLITRDNTPEFSWSSANDATSYEIDIAKDSAFTSLVHTGNSGSALSYTAPVLLDGKYYWRVRGVNRFGSAGSWSASRTITIDTTPPPAPLLYLPANLSSSRGTPLFSWNASSGAQYYQFRTMTTLGIVIFTSPEQTALNLRPPDQPLGTLLWDVRARDAAGNWSGWSSARALLIKPKIPAVPALYSPLNGLAMMNRTPTLDWSEVPDGTMYEFQVSSTDTFKTVIQGGTTPSSEFTLISLADGKYFWRVRALNIDNEPGKWSGIRYFFVDNVAPRIPSLYIPRDNLISKGTPIYYWYSVSSGAYYQFRYSAIDGTVLYTSLEAKTTNHRPPTQPIGNYLWQVRARDKAGNWSNWSGTRSIEIQAPITTGPALISPINGSAMMNRMPSLDWSEVPYGVKYEYQVATGYTFVTILQSGTTANSEKMLTSLADGKYYWHVRAINAYNQPGKWSSYRYFSVDNVAPISPALYLPVDNKINLGTPIYYWKSVTSGTYYQFRYTSTTGTVLYTSLETKATNHKPPPQPIGFYNWQARARDIAGNWSGWSPTRLIEIRAPIPAAPKLAIPANKALTTDTTPLFNWLGADYATGYEVQISKNSGFTAIVQQPVVTGITEYTAEPLIVSGTGTYYYWRVRSINTYGQKGSWSAYRYFKLIP
jgi:predicted secreted protein